MKLIFGATRLRTGSAVYVRARAVRENDEFVLEARNCLLKTRNFVLRMMDFADGLRRGSAPREQG